MPPRTGAQVLLETLRQHDVDTVFGLPGVHNLAIWESLKDAGMRMIGVRHEQTAAYAADGYARTTGRLGVAVVTSGPGAANTVAATGEAMASGSPVLVIATDVPSALRRPGVYRGLLHESRDQQAMFAPLVKHAATVADGAEIAPQAALAIRTATRAPHGPAYLGIPTDLLSAPVVPADMGAIPGDDPVDQPAAEALAAARALISSAARPLIWAGGGARSAGAGSEVAALANLIAAPVLTTYGARGLVPWEHPYLVHGPVHVPEVGKLWDDADLVIAVGTDFDAIMTQNWLMPGPSRLVAINVSEIDATKNYQPDVVIRADARAGLRALLAGLPEQRDGAGVQRTVRATNERIEEVIRGDEPEAAALFAALERTVPDGTPIVADMCIPGYWVAGFHRFGSPRRLLYPMGWGTLGFGFPAALGAAAAVHSSSGRVVCICGDGGFLFACGELAAAAEEQLPVTVVIVDDGGYGMLRYDQVVSGYDVLGVDLHTPDFADLARAFHIDATEVEGFGAPFQEALHRAVRRSGPNVVVVRASLAPPLTSSTRWYRRRATDSERTGTQSA